MIQRCGGLRLLRTLCLSNQHQSLPSRFAQPRFFTTPPSGAAFGDLDTDDVQRAVSEYHKVLQADPDNKQVLVALAWCDLAGSCAAFYDTVKEDAVRAAECYKKAVSEPGCGARVHYQFSQLLLRQGDIHGARTQLERALEMDPDSARLHCAYGALLADHFDAPDVAERCFLKALGLDDYDYDVHLQFAKFLQHSRKDWAQAEEHYTKCLALDVHDGTPILAEFLLATMGRQRGPRRFEALVADATDFPLLAFSSFAQWAVDEREDCRLAEEFFKKCLAIPPEDSNVDPPLYAQIVLRYAFFCVHHMRQLQTANQLVQYAAKAVPDLAPDILAQFEEMLQAPPPAPGPPLA
eukprot:TRINITY_DN7107_c0_g1_i1.p1 TRINITY_DN7107_c0_g1~~TRINITY_DN7107_c0_g1_i1.p1  ORF type:complete len:368 (+),score=102.32 TRINITY_DN7107_c0_g1_i1:54-1106(+)